jgi:HEAT repeat protein
VERLTPAERATVIDSLAQGLDSSSTAVQLDVIRAIAGAGPEGSAAVPALYGALRSDSAQVREAARLAIRARRR